MSTSENGSPLITMRGISKRFGGVTALDDVDLEANAGEVLAIVGDNGAGKSTLIKILTGVYRPSAGSMTLQGEPLTMNSHSEAIESRHRRGLPDACAGRSPDPGGEPLPRQRADEEGARRHAARQPSHARGGRAGARADRLGVRLRSMDVPTESLSGGQRQAVAIARAVYHSDLKLLVMDEPTAALGPQETARTLKLIETVRDQGIAVVVISHSLDDVFAVSDRIQVMRRGKRVGVVNTRETDVTSVLAMIVGAADADKAA